MSTNASDHKLTDIMAEAVSPALIMALVGSLVFFLVEVLYVGQYPGNLLWGLFFFVFAAVLIARLSIHEPAKAQGYALLLAVPVWLTLQFYVEYPPETPLADVKWAVNIGLMAVIWWSAHRLTWDCTFIDEDADVAGVGLLQAAGLDQPGGAEAEAAEEAADAPAAGWWERYRRYREHRRKKHTPGVWVVYFSLAALPLFGLGQSLIPVEEEGRRRYVFWLMVVYVGSGLGLLLTTTFLGLRHYLRQRQVKIPRSLVGVWLTMGGALVAVLLVLGAVLPRPQTEYPLVELPGVGSPKQKASRYALKGGSAGEGEGRRVGEQPRDAQKGQPEAGSQGKRGDGQGQADGQKGDGGGRGNKNAADGGKQPGDRSGNGQQRGGDQSGNERGNQGDRRESRDSSGQQRGQERESGGREQRGQDKGQRQDPASRQQVQGDRGQPAQADPAPPPERSFLSGLWSLLAALLPILKWIVLIAFIAVVAFVVLRGLLRFLANFTNWARDLVNALRALWQGLFGGWARKTAAEGEAADVVPATPPRPFASYTNPFTDGSADRLSPEKLVRYTFEAFQAWAWEHHLGRRPDETPIEFAARVGGEVPGLEEDAQRLAALYARALYARGPLPENVRAVVEQFWKRLEAVAEQPLSA
jgi:hypothetical protein